MSAPELFSDIHRTLVDALSDMDSAATFIAQGIDDLDPDALDQGTTLLLSATETMNGVTPSIDAAGEQRSGVCDI